MQLISFFNSPIGQDLIMVLAILATAFFHRTKPQIQQEVNQVLPPEEAKFTNEWLDLIDQVTEHTVKDANDRIVNGLKQHSLFTIDTAKAVKQSVLDDILSKFPQAPDNTTWIVSHLIEEYVMKHKAP